MTKIERIDSTQARAYIKDIVLSKEEKWGMDYCFSLSMYMWAGLIDGRLACLWGLIPPTLLSNQAYLWLYTTDVIKEHTSICGHAIAGADKSIKWLRWLGAKFGEPQGKGIPFRITRNG